MRFPRSLFSLILAAAALAFAPTLLAPQRAGAQASPAPPAASPSASASPAAMGSAAAAIAPAAIVHVSEFAYKPVTVTVRAGDTVEFVNDDSTPHTVTAPDKSFDSGNLDQHATWSHTFAKAGTYGYTCAYHAFMLGKVIVTAAP